MSTASSSVRCIVPEMKNFVLTDRLGSGTYATVYKAYKKGPKRDVVAVKCIDRRRLTKVSMENLLTEIEVMKELDHPHIVKLKDFEWNDRFIFLIMEYCDGGDLSHFIKSNRVLKEWSARKFLRQIALALQFLRSKGIAHMDLKPQNLLLVHVRDRKPVLKLGDFGMAQHMSSGDIAESFRGSPLYMAPEIMLGQPYDAKVDLWSVGVILYESLFGMAPFASETFDELEEKVLDSTPIEIPSRPPLSENCRHFLKNLLERDPNKRLSFDDFFNHPFIDLEHIPSPDSLPKARSLVLQAVAKDSEGKITSAVNYYCQALEYFLPAVEFEEDHATREALKQKIGEYVVRAEQLKEILKSKRPSQRQEQPPVRLIEQMQADNPKLKAALVKARLADELEVHHDYYRALEMYKESVSILISIVDEFPTREQKKLIRSEAQVFLNRAEEISLLPITTPTLDHSQSYDGSETSDSKCKVQ